jgi:hypothetical protein
MRGLLKKKAGAEFPPNPLKNEAIPATYVRSAQNFWMRLQASSSAFSDVA